MTKQEILAMTGLSEPEFYAQYPTQEAFQMAMGGMVEEYKKGGWIQKATASIKRRGTEGVCTGSNFGGPSCRPGTRRYNLAKTFRKMAKARKKEDGGEVEMYEDGGKLPEGILRSRLEAHMSPDEAQSYIDSYGEGGYTVKRSSDRKGKTHVVIGPDGTKKYFGDPNMGQREDSEHGKEAFYARHAKNLKNNPYFRAYARATWEDGGLVDVYQLMGMPTPEMYGMGGYAPIGMYSHVMSRKNVPNMGMAYGGMVPAYKKGGFANTMEDVGKLALNTLAAPVEQVTGNNFVNWNYNNDWAADTAAVSEGVIGGATDVAGSVFLGPAYGMGKGQLQQFTKGMGTSQEKQRGAADWANKTGQIASSAGDLTAGIMSGNPQQIVGGAGKFLSTTGSELGSKELGTLGNFASMGSSFINPGTNTPQFGYPNYYGNYGSFPMMAAMGGQVNYPEGLQMGDGSYVPMMNRPTTDRLLSNRSANRIPIFAMGGSTGNTIDINVEKGELLIDPETGKILTEYRGGGMVPHPEKGIDERGTVSAQEGKFVIPKKYAERYKKADKLGKKSVMQLTVVEKAKKEAKEKQLAMLEEQKAAKAMNRMVAKYGGAIQRMYAQGGMIPKYDPGSWVTGDEGFDFATQGQAPLSTASNYWSEQSIGPTTNTGLWNLFNTFSNNPTRPSTDILNTPTQPRVVGAPFTGQGPLKTQVYNPTYNTGLLEGIPKLPMSMTEMYRQAPSYTPSPAVQGTEGFKSPSAGSAGYTPSPSAIQGSANAGGGAGMGTSQMDKYLMAAQFLPAAYNIGRGLFEKAWQPGTYETPADLKWEDMTGEAGRRNMLRAYNLAKYNARQIGGSGALAALQAGSTGYQQNLADYEEALENRNKLGRAEVNRLNKAIQQANMQMRMQRDYLAQQAREQKAGMVGAGIEGIGQGAGQLWQNKQMMDALRMAYPQNTYTPGTTPSTTSSGSITPSMPFTGGERIMFDTSRPSVRQIRSWNSYKG